MKLVDYHLYDLLALFNDLREALSVLWNRRCVSAEVLRYVLALVEVAVELRREGVHSGLPDAERIGEREEIGTI